MVDIKVVRESNAKFKETCPPGLVALFAGGTSGIGKGTLIQFVKHANAPTVYLTGRSKTAASSLLTSLQELNPQSTVIFIETEISLIKNVDKVCEQIKAKEKKVDLIFLSPGYLSFEGRQDTEEGLDTRSSLLYYSRLRFIYNLLPLLEAAPNPRVISILAGGRERAIDIDDLELHKNYNLKTITSTATTQTTLSFEELAKAHPTISFSHVYPGFVNTGQIDRLMQTAKGIWSFPAFFVRWTLVPLISNFARTVDEAGEWGLFVATSAKYPPAKPKDSENVGVALSEGVTVARSSVVEEGKGNGVYRLDNYGETVQNECDEILAGYRSEGIGKGVWEQTLATWDRVLG